METVAAQSVIAFAAGMVLNFMPCVLPVMPFKVQALLRETSGTAHSRAMAAASLLAGSLAFFVMLGAVTAVPGLVEVGAGKQIILLDADTGAILKRFTAAGKAKFYGAGAISHGLLLQGDTAGNLYAIGAPNSP